VQCISVGLLLVTVVVLGNIAEVEVVIAGGDGCD